MPDEQKPSGRHPKSEQLYYQMLDKYFTKCSEAKKEGGFRGRHTVFFPVEILYAMGMTPLHNEVTTWTSALLLGNQADFLTAGAEAGLAAEICSPHRGLAGGYFRNIAAQPDVVLWSNLICDNTAKSGEYIQEMTGCPGFFLDHPFGTLPRRNAIWSEELKDLITFLEKTLRAQNGLGQAVAKRGRDGQANQTPGRNLRTAQSRPLPFPTRRFLEFLTVDYMFAGQPEETEYLTALRDELAEMVKRGQGAVYPEKFRLMTFFVPPIYLIAFLERFSGIRRGQRGRASVYLLEIFAARPRQTSRERGQKILYDSGNAHHVRSARTTPPSRTSGLRQGIQSRRLHLLCLHRLPPYLRHDQDVQRSAE